MNLELNELELRSNSSCYSATPNYLYPALKYRSFLGVLKRKVQYFSRQMIQKLTGLAETFGKLLKPLTQSVILRLNLFLIEKNMLNGGSRNFQTRIHSLDVQQFLRLKRRFFTLMMRLDVIISIMKAEKKGDSVFLLKILRIVVILLEYNGHLLSNTLAMDVLSMMP